MYLRQHYMTPLGTSSPSVPISAWIITQRWLSKSGRPVSQSVYLAQHGYTQLTSYQPADRFWTFQWIEGSWLLALSMLLIATTVWLVHRRPA